MEVSISRAELSRGLSIVSRAVATRATLPICQHVMIQAGEEGLKLSATNLELSISTMVQAEVKEEGGLTLPAKMFTELVSSFSDGLVELGPGGTKFQLKIISGRSKASMNITEADDFPPIPEVKGETAVLEAESLKYLLPKVIGAAADEASRPVLTGVYMKFDGDEVAFAAADGFRLAAYGSQLIRPVGEMIDCIVPARSLVELHRLIGGNEPVEMVIAKNNAQVAFSLNHADLTSQLLNGVFPDYQQLIPKGYKTKITFDVAKVSKAVKSANVFAKDSSGVIRLQVSEGQLVISGSAEQHGGVMHELELEGIEGDDEAKIAFNARYLVDVLGALGNGQGELSIQGPSSPGLFRSVALEEYVHVVMPMFVQWEV